jgi:hypothetical protein
LKGLPSSSCDRIRVAIACTAAEVCGHAWVSSAQRLDISKEPHLQFFHGKPVHYLRWLTGLSSHGQRTQANLT